MKRQIAGLGASNRADPSKIPDGLFLVSVKRVSFQRQAQKPYYTMTLAIVEPTRFANQTITGRLYCTQKALWKLNWFLRDFGYDADQLNRDEIDETQLVGLKGLVKVSRVSFNGSTLLRFDGFAPVSRWIDLSPSNLDSSEVA
jgi:hypothetical protein